MKTDSEVLAGIQELYLCDRRPLYIGFSGGKDSTVVLSLVSRAIRELAPELRTKPIYVLMSDTLMEMPPVIGQILNAVQSFMAYVEKYDLPFEFHRVEPAFKNRFWNLVIGRGATLPRTDMRWCTLKMKVVPMEQKVAEVLQKHNGYVAVTGARKDESADRRARLERNAVTPGSKLKTHPDSRCNLLCPIEDWSVEDVWLHIYTDSEEWVDKEGLGIIYAEAAGDGDECRTVLEGGEEGSKPGCVNSSRFGCWFCPIQGNRDKSLANMAVRHPYLLHLEELRNYLMQFQNGEWHHVRDVYNHADGFPRLQYNYSNHRFGMTGPGGYTLEFRREMLVRLLQTEKKVRETSDIRLIEDEDLEWIQHLWLREGDIDLTCQTIASEFGRSINVSYDDRMYAKYSRGLYRLKSGYAGKLMAHFGIHVNERFCAQFFMEKFDDSQKKAGTLFSEIDLGDELNEFIRELINHDDPGLFMSRLVKKMKIKKQFYPTPEYEKLIRREWWQDKLSWMSSVLRDEFEGTYVEPEYDYDFTEDPNISLIDKMAALDNWNYFSENRSYADELHPEHYEFKGEFNRITFRKRSESGRKSDERISDFDDLGNDEEDRAEKKDEVVKYRANEQTTFDFAA